MHKTLSKLLALTLCVIMTLGLFGGAFAADEEGDPNLVPTAYKLTNEDNGASFDLETVCTDDGQYVVKVIVHLPEATELTAEELKDAFTVSIKDYYQFFYFIAIEGDFDRAVDSATLSDDGMTVTLELPIPSDFFESLAAKADYIFYTDTGYVVTAATEVGGLEEGDEIAFSGTTADPEADKWGAVAVDETAGTYNYRYFDPTVDGYTAPEAGFPLVVWLHGAGEIGTEANGFDNNLQITANRVTAWGEKETQELFGGAYVLAPQTGKVGDPLAFGWTPENVVKTIEAFIAKVGEANVDRNRIVIGGCSMGGMGTWNTIKEYPNYFAAAFPVCGSATNFDPTATLSAETLLSLKQLPIYCIHTVEDGTVAIANTLTAYDQLTSVGKTNIYLNLFEHTWTFGTPDETEEDIAALAMNGHSSWIYAHNDIDGVKIADKYFMDEYTVGEGDTAKTYKSTKPADIGEGYTSFKAWLAAQERPEAGVYYTVEKEVVSFGEVAKSVTVHGLDYMKRTTADSEFISANPVVVTVKGVGEEGADVVRVAESTTIGEDRTSIVVTFADGQTWVPPADNMADAISKYVVTLKGEEVVYGGESNPQVEAFEELTYEVEPYSVWGSTEQMTTMSARGFTPDKETYKQDKYPLIIWQHGVGELGTDNRIHITANDVVAWSEKETQDVFGGAYVLSIQNHAAYSAVACKSVIDQFIAEKGDIDETRVYIGGCSMGGGATWTMIKQYPNFFAAAFPICMGGDLTEADIENLKDMPIYMTVSSGDSAGIVTGMINSYNQLKAAGSENVWISIFEHSVWPGSETINAFGAYVDHFSWTYAHNDYDAKGEDRDGAQFIDCSKDGVYNDGIVTVKDGILSYSSEVTTDMMGQPLDEPYTESATLEGKNNRPEDAGYETFKAWISDQTNKKPSPFVDVDSDNENYDAIIALYKAGLTKGTSANTYEPDASMTRAEFVTFLARAAKVTLANKKAPDFTDLVEDWYMGSVAWGVEVGLLQGYAGPDGKPNGLFGPYDPVTTEQVNLIVGRLLANVEGFTAAEGQTFAEAGDTPATRGEIASVINALAQNYTAPAAE